MASSEIVKCIVKMFAYLASDTRDVMSTNKPSDKVEKDWVTYVIVPITSPHLHKIVFKFCSSDHGKTHIDRPDEPVQDWELIIGSYAYHIVDKSSTYFEYVPRPQLPRFAKF